MKRLLFCLCFLPLVSLGQITNNLAQGIYFYDNCEGTDNPMEYWCWGCDPRTTWTAGGGWSQEGNPNGARMYRVTSGQTIAGIGPAPTARKGNKMNLAVVPKPTDAEYGGSSGSVTNNRIRSEMYWSHGYDSRVNDFTWSAMSLYIPANHCNDQGPIGIAFDSKFVSASGPASYYMMWQNGRWVTYAKACEGCPQINKDIGPAVKGQWVDVALKRNWREDASGYIELYINGELRDRRTGPNIQYDGYGEGMVSYMIMGVYVWGWEHKPHNENMTCPGPVTIYYDEYKFGSSQATLQTMSPDAVATPNPNTPDRLLVFSKTAAFRHSSIATGISAIQAIGASNNFQVTATEDATMFRLDTLQKFKAVAFLNTTGDILTGGQQTAFEQYIQNGGGFVGIHSAFDTEYGWPWYGELLGTWFSDHPAEQNATVRKLNNTHPSTATLPTTWGRFDEWYNFGTWQRSVDINPLLKVDETTYSGGTEGDPHLISWYGPYDGGRSWVTAMGHNEASYNDNNFRTHLAGGIQYAMYGSTGNQNQPPTVSAGSDKAITSPTTTTSFTGTASDPDGTIMTYAWTKVSGPAGGTIATPAAASTNISALEVGTYVYQLTVTDNLGLTASDNVTVVVSASPPVGDPPSVYAGNNQIVNTTTVQLTGSATVPNGGPSYLWTKETGTGGTIQTPTALSTLVTGLVNGQSYRFKLVVTDDDDLTGEDTVNVTVDIPVPNQPPTVSAGSNQTITLPVDSVTLIGSASDADGSIVTYSWTKVSGPAGENIMTPILSTTKVKSLVQGDYIFRLTATDDDGAFTQATVQVVVQPPIIVNLPPVANATPEIIYVEQPSDTANLIGNVYDQNVGGYIQYANWEFVSGPMTPNIFNDILINTTKQARVSNLDSLGQYIFRLDVYDNNNSYASAIAIVEVKDTIIPVVNQAPIITVIKEHTLTYPDVFMYIVSSAADDRDTSQQLTVRWQKVSGPAATLSDTVFFNMDVTFTQAGTYTFRVTVTDSEGLSDTEQVTVIVKEPKRQEKYLLQYTK